MRKTMFAMMALAAGVALTGFASAPANALPVTKSMAATQSSDVVQVRQGGGHGGHAGISGGGMRHGGVGISGGAIRHGGIGIRSGGGRHFNGRHNVRRHHGSRIRIAPVYGYRSYNDGCYWLKRKALNTGSRYWWRRYNECRWG